MGGARRKFGGKSSWLQKNTADLNLIIWKMSNFCSAVDNRGWSREPSEGSQRRFEPSRHAKKPPLSSMNRAMNPISRQGAHSHHTEREGYVERRRDGVGQWGRQQFNRPSAKFSGPGASGQRNVGGGNGSASQPTEPASSPLRTAIKDLYPHQPNTVRSLKL